MSDAVNSSHTIVQRLALVTATATDAESERAGVFCVIMAYAFDRARVPTLWQSAHRTASFFIARCLKIPAPARSAVAVRPIRTAVFLPIFRREVLAPLSAPPLPEFPPCGALVLFFVRLR